GRDPSAAAVRLRQLPPIVACRRPAGLVSAAADERRRFHERAGADRCRAEPGRVWGVPTRPEWDIDRTIPGSFPKQLMNGVPDTPTTDISVVTGRPTWVRWRIV